MPTTNAFAAFALASEEGGPLAHVSGAHTHMKIYITDTDTYVYDSCSYIYIYIYIPVNNAFASLALALEEGGPFAQVRTHTCIYTECVCITCVSVCLYTIDIDIQICISTGNAVAVLAFDEVGLFTQVCTHGLTRCN